MTWAVTWQSLAVPVGVREFLRDHGIAFEERHALGGIEIGVRCTEEDALRLADALQLVGIRQLFDGDSASLLIVRPERSKR